MNPFALNLEASKPETGLIQPSFRIFENENTQKSEFAEMLKIQLTEEPARKEKTAEKDNPSNLSPDESVKDKEFLENADDNRLYERLAVFSHETAEKKVKSRQVEKKENFQLEAGLSAQNEAAGKSKINNSNSNAENQKTASDHVKKTINGLSREEKHLNDPDRFLENGILAKGIKNEKLDDLKKMPMVSKKDQNGSPKESVLVKPENEKEIKPSAEKLKNQKNSAFDSEKTKSAAVPHKMVQEENEQPVSKITADTLSSLKTEISAETKNGHTFQFSREGQFSKTELPNNPSSVLQARPVYNFQEQLQSLLDNAKIYVKDGKNGTFHVNLYPRSLGNVSVNLGLEHGVLNGRFLVENNDVKEALLQNFDNIKQQLAESGITVGEFHVNVRGEKEKHTGELQKEVVNYRGSFSENEEVTAVYEVNSTSYHKGSINMVI